MTTHILGIDPGLNRTGYAVLERSASGPALVEGGVIRSTPGLPLAERIFEIAHGLREVIVEFRPESLAVEQVFSHAEYPKTAVLMAHARGAILFVARDHALPTSHYTPTQIKRLLTGSGRASKEQIQRAIQREFGLESLLEPNDVADAAAVAVCHFYALRSQQTLRLAE
jgi:crossover junction endodeoxyribonuclease RuvC